MVSIVAMLARTIRKHRAAAGLSQRGLARRAKVTPGYIAQLERGLRASPSLPVIRRLARALGVRVGELLE